jgi:hypothetical protein
MLELHNVHVAQRTVAAGQFTPPEYIILRNYTLKRTGRLVPVPKPNRDTMVLSIDVVIPTIKLNQSLDQIKQSQTVKYSDHCVEQSLIYLGSIE